MGKGGMAQPHDTISHRAVASMSRIAESHVHTRLPLPYQFRSFKLSTLLTLLESLLVCVCVIAS